MDLKKLKEEFQITPENIRKNIVFIFDASATLMKLFEEAGKLSEAYLTHIEKSRPEKFVSEENVKNKVARELADIVGVLMMMVNVLNINLEKAIDKKWINKDK